MAYNVSIHGTTNYGRSGEKGHDSRPTPFAMPAGSPVPNLKSTRKPYTQTTPSTSEVESAAVAKNRFKPKTNLLRRHKLAYEIGLEVGKCAAYPLQENTPIPQPNELPAHAPQTQMVAPLKVIGPKTETYSVKMPKSKPASGK